MASDNGTLVYNFRGVKYTKELGPPNSEKIRKYEQELREGEMKKLYDSSRYGLLASSVDALINRKAVARERSDRVAAAKREVEQANSTVLNQGEDPNGVIPGGGVASGDPGISQRRTVADPKLQGVKDTTTNPDANADAKKVRTDADQIKSLSTLADKLNDLVYAHPRAGFVTRSIKPSGEGAFFDQVVDMAYQMSGHGHQNAQLAQIFSKLDRFERSLAPKNIEQTGYTFITRPRLNLSDANLAADRRFAALRTDRVEDVAFGIRCLLDTKFCQDHISEAMACPLIDVRNPFAVLLCNSLTSINGYQDPILATETTDGGYFQESQSYAIGGDRMARGYDFTLNFRDYPGSPVAATFDYWYQYMMNLGDGSMIQYADAIDANRLDYTVSIYRFIVDRTRKVITKWSKATGCFPTNTPSGVPFNKNQGESIVSANDNFGINFKVNHIGYTNDPLIIQEFNILVRRYLNKTQDQMSFKAYAHEAQNNFTGIPYVAIGDFGYELVFLHEDDSVALVKNSSSANVNTST